MKNNAADKSKNPVPKLLVTRADQPDAAALPVIAYRAMSNAGNIKEINSVG
jgi:hypothetical protein